MSNENEMGTHEAPINMDETDSSHQFLRIQLKKFFNEMLPGTNSKTFFLKVF